MDWEEVSLQPLPSITTKDTVSYPRLSNLMFETDVCEEVEIEVPLRLAFCPKFQEYPVIEFEVAPNELELLKVNN